VRPAKRWACLPTGCDQNARCVPIGIGRGDYCRLLRRRSVLSAGLAPSFPSRTA
jgi:hypothetical protein